VKDESTTISPSHSHEVNSKVFQVLQSKEVNYIIVSDISRSLLVEKLSLNKAIKSAMLLHICKVFIVKPWPVNWWK